MLDLSRYVGRWIEIARLPNWFEHGAFATADYSLTTDGIQVVNTSFDEKASQRPLPVCSSDWPEHLRSDSPARPGPNTRRVGQRGHGLAIVGNSVRSSLWIPARSPFRMPKRCLLGQTVWVQRRQRVEDWTSRGAVGPSCRLRLFLFETGRRLLGKMKDCESVAEYVKLLARDSRTRSGIPGPSKIRQRRSELLSSPSDDVRNMAVALDHIFALSFGLCKTVLCDRLRRRRCCPTEWSLMNRARSSTTRVNCFCKRCDSARDELVLLAGVARHHCHAAGLAAQWADHQVRDASGEAMSHSPRVIDQAVAALSRVIAETSKTLPQVSIGAEAPLYRQLAIRVVEAMHEGLSEGASGRTEHLGVAQRSAPACCNGLRTAGISGVV